LRDDPASETFVSSSSSLVVTAIRRLGPEHHVEYTFDVIPRLSDTTSLQSQTPRLAGYVGASRGPNPMGNS